ncbi:hypothetical protein D0859_10429 [Hortaea werneckii]|uniref:Uncharacterized protein n=1 Tax=Hortaea werneckii TaxID=91943 RepID=A0A3M7IJ02_HORWE|nr:hypothetical protein D0859_10429 [Hortaea werneckii]
MPNMPASQLNLPAIRQRRSYRPRASPASRRRNRAPTPLTPGESHQRKTIDERRKNACYANLNLLYSQGYISCRPEDGVEFLNAFSELANVNWRKNVVDKDAFRALVARYQLSPDDLTWMSLPLLRAGSTDDKALGKKLVYTMSACGDPGATMRILNQVLSSPRTGPEMLRSSEIVDARGHLREMAREGEDYRAMVLEGKVSYELGDDESAIDLWTRAIEPAVEAAQSEVQRKEQQRAGTEPPAAHHEEVILADLDSPWIELTAIHYERYSKFWAKNSIAAALAELEKAKWACGVGCAQDDPTSHYQAAELFKDYNAEGEFSHTSKWLYHITKAAASGHVRACHALADFYSSSGWKYIEDEPPDHVKPTPFDFYPAPPATHSENGNTFGGWLSWLGLSSSKPKLSPSEQMFQTAAYPSTPHDRFKMAMLWLEVAVEYTYAPSYLLAAKMYLEKDLWGQAHAPASALELKDERYTYASKEDFEAGRPTASTDEDGSSDVENPKSEVRPDEPNPGYNPEQAKIYIREVLYAVEAIKFYHGRLTYARDLARRGQFGVDDAGDVVDGYVQTDTKQIPPHIKKFLRYPAIREMWEGDAKAMEREAKDICEREGWDLYDEQGGLVYRHGMMRPTRGAATAAAAAAGGR